MRQELQHGRAVGHADQGRRALSRARDDAQHGARDDAEDAGRADEELLGVEAGVVLAQRRHQVQHRAVGQDHLDAQQVLSHVPVPEDARARGVGGHHAAHGRVGAEVDGEQQALLGQGGVELAQQDAPAGHDGAIHHVDLELSREALQAEHDHLAGGVRSRRAHEPGVRALGQDADAAGAGEGEDPRDLLGAAGTDGGQGLALAVAPALLVAGQLVRLGEHRVARRAARPAPRTTVARSAAVMPPPSCGPLRGHARSCEQDSATAGGHRTAAHRIAWKRMKRERRSPTPAAVQKREAIRRLKQALAERALRPPLPADREGGRRPRRERGGPAPLASARRGEGRHHRVSSRRWSAAR